MKKLDINELVGFTIKSFDKAGDKELIILTEQSSEFRIILEDDWCGCNDSYASFQEIKLDGILGQKIISATEQNHPSKDGAFLIIETDNGTGSIEMVHDSNGYYGWGYEIFKI
jgi:hypothetical protein